MKKQFYNVFWHNSDHQYFNRYFAIGFEQERDDFERIVLNSPFNDILSDDIVELTADEVNAILTKDETSWQDIVDEGFAERKANFDKKFNH